MNRFEGQVSKAGRTAPRLDCVRGAAWVLSAVVWAVVSAALAQPVPEKTWVAKAPSGLLLERSLVNLPAPEKPYVLQWQTLDDLVRLQLLGIQTQMFSPPRTARALALLSVSINDTLVLMPKGLEPNVAVGAAAQEVMLYLHPTLPNFKDGVRQNLEAFIEKARADGVPPRTVEASRLFGRNVGQQIMNWGRADGSGRQVIPTYPKAAPGVWVLPLGRPAAEPGWGNVRPIGVSLEQLAKSEPPPAWDSPAYESERQRFWAEQPKLDQAGKDIAEKWAGDPGTVTPAGLWQEIAFRFIRDQRYTPEQAIAVLAPLNVAMHNSFIACWRDKFDYYTLRPDQWVRTFDKKWRPYLRTPRFPAYPSGHATVSGTAAAVLSAFFPAQTSFFQAEAKEASYSRIIAGIHWFVDGSGGLELGRRVAEQVLALDRGR